MQRPKPNIWTIFHIESKTIVIYLTYTHITGYILIGAHTSSQFDDVKQWTRKSVKVFTGASPGRQRKQCTGRTKEEEVRMRWWVCKKNREMPGQREKKVPQGRKEVNKLGSDSFPMYLPELKYVLLFGLLSLCKLLFQFTIWIKCQLLYSVLRDGSRSKYAPTCPYFYSYFLFKACALSCKTEEYHNYKHKCCLYSKVCPWQIWSSIPGVTLMELKHPVSIKFYRIMVGLVLWQWTL